MFTSVLALVIFGLPAPQQPSTALRMQSILKSVVQETGAKLLSVGSWISQTNYRDPLKFAAGSDHDLRLLMPPGTTAEDANQAWRAVRQKIIEKVRAEFGKDASKVLANTNFYAPSQLMSGVETQADALERFAKLGQVPNLGYSGKVTASTPMKLAEGLYGPGAGAYTQAYERSAGRLFYSVNGKVYSGMADLVHEGEGIAKYTVSGSASTAFQWAAHAEEAMKASSPEAVAKYLARLERDLVKARDLARLPVNTALRAELAEMASKLRANPRALTSLEGPLTSLLHRASLEGALLSRFDRGGLAQKAILRVAIDGIEAGNKVGKALTAALEKIPGSLVVEGMVTMFSTYMASRSLGEEDYMSALSHVSPLFVELGPAASMLIVQSILEAAKENGYDFVANRQSAFDLLEGIFSATGRVDERKYTVDQLVDSFHTEEALKAFVQSRAAQAADRGFGDVSGRHDMGTAEAIFTHCYPIIFGAWQQVRDGLVEEITKLADGIEANDIQLAYMPNPAQITKGEPLTVTVSSIASNLRLGQSLARIRANLGRLLGATEPIFANAVTTWTPKGAETSLSGERAFSFAQPGIYPVQYEIRVGIGSANLPRGSFLLRDVIRRASIDVEVLPGEGKAEPPPPTAGTTSGTYPSSPYRGTQVVYEISGVSVAKQKDDNGAASAARYRDIRFKLPLGTVRAKGHVSYGEQNEVYGPWSSARARLRVVVYASDKLSEADVRAKLNALKAQLPPDLFIFAGGQFGVTRETTKQIKQGESLQFDFTLDLSWLSKLPKELVQIVSVEFIANSAMNGGVNDVIVAAAGTWERPK